MGSFETEDYVVVFFNQHEGFVKLYYLIYISFDLF